MNYTTAQSPRREKNALRLELRRRLGSAVHERAAREFSVEATCREQKAVYDTVLKAHLAVIDYVKPGVVCSDVDKVARDIIEKDYPGTFGHGLGHGVGFEIHEWPRFGRGDSTLAAEGMVVTDEPGRTVMEMTLKEGKNREIRRMCEAVGLEVVRLKRNAEGVVKLGMLKPGTYRELTKAEINGLRSAAAKGRAQTRSAALQSKAAERRPRGPVGKSAPKKRK